MQHRYDKTHPYSINVIEVAADQVPEVFRALPPSYSQIPTISFALIGSFPRRPEEWREYLAGIHEIWAPNKFVATAFAKIFNGPIIVMPPAIDTGGNHPGRAHFGLDEERFYFMFSFDYHSSPFRKNPLGVLKAFECAFPRGDENVGLIIKSTGDAHYPDIKITIDEAMARDRRVLMIDRNMPREEMLGLIQASDAYLSLHRAEGFGLGMAEAMTFGRIVIGTDYSGCTDFLTDKTGFPVPYHCVRWNHMSIHGLPANYGQSPIITQQWRPCGERLPTLRKAKGAVKPHVTTCCRTTARRLSERRCANGSTYCLRNANPDNAQNLSHFQDCRLPLD